MRLSNLIKVSLLLLCTACYKESDYTLSEQEKINEVNCIINIVPADTNLLANGSDNTDVRISLESKYYSSIKSLLVTTSGGTFNDLEKDSIILESFKLDGVRKCMYADVKLNSSTTKSDEVKLVVSVQGLEKENNSIKFKEVPIELLGAVQVEPFYISKDSIQEVIIRVTTYSEEDKLASNDKDVWFEVDPVHGVLKNTKVITDDQSVASTTFVFNNIGSTTPIIFTAKALNSKGDTISSTGMLRVF